MRERGVLLSDRTRSCQPNFERPRHPNRVNGSLESSSAHGSNNQCVFQFLGTEVNTASFAMYIFSFSVLIQALLIVSMSGAADHGKYRKLLLLTFAFTGAIATMLFVVTVPKLYVLGAVLAIISNTCFGASFVLLNSFLPLLVRHHPSIVELSRNNAPRAEHGRAHAEDTDDYEEHHLESSTDALLSSTVPFSSTKEKEPGSISPELVLSTQISSYGIGIGYIAAVVVQSLAIAIILITGYLSMSSTLGIRLVLLFVGSWWFIFTIPSALWLRPRPGPP